MLVEIFKIDLLSLIVSPGHTWHSTFKDIVEDKTINKIYLTHTFDAKAAERFGDPYLMKIIDELGDYRPLGNLKDSRVSEVFRDLSENVNNSVVVGLSYITDMWINTFNEQDKLVIPETTRLGYELYLIILRRDCPYAKAIID